MRFQSIYDIAQLCAEKGIGQVVLCPGSRCAPLTLAFTRHPKINAKTFSDERSAGFIALGIAQARNEAVAMVCTSGTAAYNFSPAVAEACFSETPLVVFTADRPAEWIGQHDGQTIYQADVFGKHVKRSFNLPQDYEHPDDAWAVNRIINEAINLARDEPRGPVHINAPFREPLYPGEDETFAYTKGIRVIRDHQRLPAISDAQKQTIIGKWNSFNRILVVAGQHRHDSGAVKTLASFLRTHQVPFAADVISNFHDITDAIRHADLFLGQAGESLKESLQPDLLITFGQSLISKNTKLFLRKYKPREHWHIQAAGAVADTFKHVTDIFRCEVESFFGFLSSLGSGPTSDAYAAKWKDADARVSGMLSNLDVAHPTWELAAVKALLEALPGSCHLHLANSMSVRYANFLGLEAGKKSITVFSNRGTSGIDGCTSTAVGNYFGSGKPTFLITGDMAFFYDRNAFWHNYETPDLRVLLLNNHGGLIFNIIDGPASMPEAEEYFITRQKLRAGHLCAEFGFEHLHVSQGDDIRLAIQRFLTFDGKAKVLEFESGVSQNRTEFDELKKQIRERYET